MIKVIVRCSPNMWNAVFKIDFLHVSICMTKISDGESNSCNSRAAGLKEMSECSNTELNSREDLTVEVNASEGQLLLLTFDAQTRL